MLTTDLIHSPLGDSREHEVPCRRNCGEMTLNVRAVCTRCEYATNATFRASCAMEQIAGDVATIIAEGGHAGLVWYDPETDRELNMAGDLLTRVAAKVRANVGTHPAQGGAA